MTEADNNFTSKTLSFGKIVLLVNGAIILYTLTDSLTKDLMEKRGAGMFDNLFLRNTIILAIVFGQIRMNK